MENINNHPRVLLILLSCINKADQHGGAVREWFADWPTENLAEIYSNGEVGEERFCGYNFKLGQKERKFGKLFFKIKKSSIGQISYSIIPEKDFDKLNNPNVISILRNRISNLLIDTGIWELIFRPKLSEDLITFIKKFDPQLIYCSGYNLTFSWLPLMIHKEFNIPICFDTTDDWPKYLYRNSPLSFIMRPIVNRTVKSLISSSIMRLTVGKRMALEYQKRYNISFEPLMLCDDLNRFRDAVPHCLVDENTKSIIYSGSLDLKRWISIIEICEAAKKIEIKDGNKILVLVFATSIPPEAINKLREIDNLKLFPGAKHEELPSLLKAADILFLPETFDPLIAEEIKFSISTKAFLYMMSEKPVLVYASPVTGIMDYAKEEEWACTVDEHDIEKLTLALKELLTNTKYRETLINRGIQVANSNHNGLRVRERFLFLISKSVKIISK